MAIDLKVKVDRNFKQSAAKFKRLSNKEWPEAAEDAITDGAINIRNLIITSIRKSPATGKSYKKRNKTHVASSPGNAPRTDSGDLIKSIMIDNRSMEVEIGSNIKDPMYPVFLEFGAARIKGMKIKSILFPRPFVGPAFDKALPKITRNVERAIVKSTGKILR